MDELYYTHHNIVCPLEFTVVNGETVMFDSIDTRCRNVRDYQRKSPELILGHRSENRSAPNVNSRNDDRNLCPGKVTMNYLTDFSVKLPFGEIFQMCQETD